MTGEMSRDDVTEEAFPIHFAIAKELGGTVEPFDVYQGPYIQLDGARLWLSSEDGIGAYVFNETTRCKSEDFFFANMAATDEGIAAAREVYPEGGIDVDAPEPGPTMQERVAKARAELEAVIESNNTELNAATYGTTDYRRAAMLSRYLENALNAFKECDDAFINFPAEG